MVAKALVISSCGGQDTGSGVVVCYFSEEYSTSVTAKVSDYFIKGSVVHINTITDF